MRYWYAYTGESLIVGHGRAIRRVVTDAGLLQRLMEMADKQYASNAQASAIPKDAFIAAFLAPLAAQEIGVTSPPATLFSSAGQVISLFAEMDIEQAAANLFNGRIASAYAGSDASEIAARVAQGFADGDLLLLPRDAGRLHSPATLNKLPGIVVFLLARAKAQQKAFADYLRRGTPPVASDADSVAMAALRPILKTWEREARLTNEMLAKGCACTAHL